MAIVDGHGTPGDTSDEFSPTFVRGDDNGGNLLDLDETWLYQATATVKLGQYVNIGDVSGVDPDGTTVTDGDPSHYLYNNLSFDLKLPEIGTLTLIGNRED